MFATGATLDAHMDIDSYASSILDYIDSNINSVTTLKRITMLPNQKLWMNTVVRLLLKTRNTAFRSGQSGANQEAAINTHPPVCVLLFGLIYDTVRRIHTKAKNVLWQKIFWFIKPWISLIPHPLHAHIQP